MSPDSCMDSRQDLVFDLSSAGELCVIGELVTVLGQHREMSEISL